MNTRKQAIARGDQITVDELETEYRDKLLKIIDKCSEDPERYKKNKGHEKVRDVFTSYAMLGKDRELVRDFIDLYSDTKKEPKYDIAEIETNLSLKRHNNNNDLSYEGCGIVRIKQLSDGHKIISISRKFYNAKTDKDIYPDRYIIDDHLDREIYAWAINRYDMIPETFTF